MLIQTLQFMKDVVDGGAKGINMHREYDGEQDLNFYYFGVEDIVRDLLTPWQRENNTCNSRLT